MQESGKFNEGIPDVERLLKLKVDLVFYPKGRSSMEKVMEAGIAVLCPFNDKYTPSTMDEYTENSKNRLCFSVMCSAEILRQGLKNIVNTWMKLLQEYLPLPRRFLNRVGPGFIMVSLMTSVQPGNNTIMRWYTELAGGLSSEKAG